MLTVSAWAPTGFNLTHFANYTALGTGGPNTTFEAAGLTAATNTAGMAVTYTVVGVFLMNPEGDDKKIQLD